MIRGDIAGLGLYDALNLCEFTLTTGSLHVTGHNRDGVLHLFDGAIGFAELSGRPDAGVERAGLPVALWERIRTDPGAVGRAASALIDVGADPGAVRRFVHDRVEHTVAELATLEGSNIEVRADRGWFGGELRLVITEVIDAARVINFGGELIGDATPEALIAMCPFDSGSVTLAAEHWNVVADLIGAFDLATLRRRLGHRPATEFVRFLQARSLATAVVATPMMGVPGLEG